MDLGMAGRKTLGTGAVRGIGRAEALVLVTEGVALAINAIDTAAAQYRSGATVPAFFRGDT